MILKIIEHILLITMLTFKILFTINSLYERTISSKHRLQFLSFKKKKHLVLIRKIHFIKQKLFKLRTFHLIKTIYLE